MGEAGIHVACHEGFAAFPDRGVDVHAGAVVAVEGFGHEGGGFAVHVGGVFDDVLVHAHVVAHFEEGVKFEVNFGLAPGGDFVVLAFGFDAEFEHGEHHFVTDVHGLVSGRGREVAFFESDFVGLRGGVLHGSGAPDAFIGVDGEEGVVGVVVVADVIEDKEFGFGPEVCGVGDAGGL